MVYLMKTLWSLVAVILTLRNRSVAADCDDPGTPSNVHRNVSPVSNAPYAVGTVMRFSCVDNTKYQLVGMVKIRCQQSGKWSSKLPRCQALFCSLPVPAIEHATLMTPINLNITNRVGGSVEYTCNVGFRIQGGQPVKICEKSGQWQGNFSCVGVTCQQPQNPANGRATYTSLNYGSIVSYRCDSGFKLIGVNRTCLQNGVWSPAPPKCSILCPIPVQPDHGTAILRYRYSYTNVPIEGAVLSYSCDERYSLHGNHFRICTKMGKWSGNRPKCVISSCGPPGPFSSSHGKVTFSHDTPYVLGTIVLFQCIQGYKLVGDDSRTCSSSGKWTGSKNPTCSEITCEDPGIVGGYNISPHPGEYSYGSLITFRCYSHHFIWGNSTRRCDATFSGTGYWTGDTPVCLTLQKFDEWCRIKGGQFAMKHNRPHCSLEDATATSSSSKSKISDHELDTLTIVTASAGSTLGALVILLSILVFVRRFHRGRRFRNTSRLRSLYGDDDRLTLVATYSGDVHFTLPSYDEAMNQVERAPPSFESVVRGAGVPTNNNPTELPQSDTNEDRASTAGGGHQSGTPGGDSSEEQINIVNNPLVQNGTSLSRQLVVNTEERNASDQQENFNMSTESIDSTDPPSSPSGTIISVEFSEDDQFHSEMQPLISTV